MNKGGANRRLNGGLVLLMGLLLAILAAALLAGCRTPVERVERQMENMEKQLNRMEKKLDEMEKRSSDSNK